MKHQRPTKGDKREVRQEMVLTYPPRLEGIVKNRGIKPKKKHRKVRVVRKGRGSEGYSTSSE